jgi:hypothetical protein
MPQHESLEYILPEVGQTLPSARVGPGPTPLLR